MLVPLMEKHPHLKFNVQSMTSRQIQMGLDEFQLDCGITYLNHPPLFRVRTLPLYDETYFFLTKSLPEMKGRASITWHEVAQHALCLLSEEMQNRRLIDAVFEKLDLKVEPYIETNSMISLLRFVENGQCSSVVAHPLLSLVRMDEDLINIPIEGPIVTHDVGLVFLDQDPASIIANEFINVLESTHKH